MAAGEGRLPFFALPKHDGYTAMPNRDCHALRFHQQPSTFHQRPWLCLGSALLAIQFHVAGRDLCPFLCGVKLRRQRRPMKDTGVVGQRLLEESTRLDSHELVEAMAVSPL